MNSDRTGFYAFIGASAVAGLLAILSFVNPFGSSPSSVDTASDEITALSVPTVAAVATPHPTAELVKPTPTPAAKKAKPKKQPAATADGDAESKESPTSTAVPQQAGQTRSVSQPNNDTGDDNNESENTGDGESSGDDSSSDETADGGGATGSTGSLDNGPTASNGSRALSASQAFTYVARAAVDGRIEVFDAPGGNPVQTTYQYLDGSVVDHPLTQPTYFGNNLVMRVVSTSGDGEWLQVALPIRPNGQTGWVRASDFYVESSSWYIEINVSSNHVSVWNGEELVLETAAVTGAGNTPTPIAAAYVEEVVAGPSAAYGPYVMSLGIFSNAHNSFGAGLPKIALHGTNQPGLLGTNASNGCIRVPNDVISQIANMVPVGTRVQIVG